MNLCGIVSQEKIGSRMPGRLARLVLIFALFGALALPAHASVTESAESSSGRVPAQFIAKLYTEALGRLPDETAWRGLSGEFRAHGCTPAMVGEAVRSFYTSDEYMALPYEHEARVLTLYRGALNREPDQAGFDHYTSVLRHGQASWKAVVEAFVNSAELAALSASICGHSPAYHFGTSPRRPSQSQAKGFAEEPAQTFRRSHSQWGRPVDRRNIDRLRACSRSTKQCR